MRWFFRTEAERLEAAKERQRRAALRAEHKEISREIDFYAKLIPEVLANCGIDYWIPSSRETVSGNHHMVQFVESTYNGDAIYLRLHTRGLPHGSNLSHLYDPHILHTLSDACGRQVLFGNNPDTPDYNPGAGSWYVIMRQGVLSMIPKVFRFKDALENIPEKSAPLRHVIGIAENKRIKTGDLAMMPHLLIGGSTGTGKSNYINSMLIQILWRNGPSHVQFLMIDLKGGVELKAFEKIPHLWRPIVKHMDDVMPALQEFEAEIQRRSVLFEKRGVKDINGWNKLWPNEALPYLILVIDELAQLMKNPDQKLRSGGEKILGSIMQISRAMGGHVILCTQRPSSDVVTGYIKTNAPARLAFAVPQNADSIVMIDNGRAAGLEPVGRGIYVWGARHVEVQTPYIPEQLAARIIKRISDRVEIEKPKPIDINYILELALDNFHGDLTLAILEKSLSGKIGQKALRRLLKEADNKVFILRGNTYLVTNYGKTRGGRKVEKVQEVANEMGQAMAVVRHKQQEVLLKGDSSHEMLVRHGIRQAIAEIQETQNV